MPLISFIKLSVDFFKFLLQPSKFFVFLFAIILVVFALSFQIDVIIFYDL